MVEHWRHAALKIAADPQALSLATTAERDLFMAPYLPTNEIDGVAFTKVYNELPAS